MIVQETLLKLKRAMKAHVQFGPIGPAGVLVQLSVKPDGIIGVKNANVKGVCDETSTAFGNRTLQKYGRKRIFDCR